MGKIVILSLGCLTSVLVRNATIVDAELIVRGQLKGYGAS